jgi:hypothetical protein
MNNSMLYHTWGAKGFNAGRTWYTKEGTFIRLDPQKRLYVCPICGSKEVTARGSIDRTIKTLPVGFREECFFVRFVLSRCFVQFPEKKYIIPAKPILKPCGD